MRLRVAIRKRISDETWKEYRLHVNQRPIASPYEFRRPDPYHEWDFEPREHEPPVCAKFGCGRTLTLRESLFGSICAHCQPEKPLMQGKSPQDEKRALMELKMRLMRF